MPLLPPNRLHELRDEVARATQPATHLERWFANQAAYASWELERVRANKNNESAEPRLNAAYSRAIRNWNRARKEIQSLQAIRAAQVACLKTNRQRSASAAPLANPSRLSQPDLPPQQLDEIIDQIVRGTLPMEAIHVVADQELR